MWELKKSFRFDSAHTLKRAYGAEAEASRRIHGHSYRAEVSIIGAPSATTGMIIDLGSFEAALKITQEALDHRLLDEVEGLGAATMENLSRWIFERLANALPALTEASLASVTVYRDSQGESCTYRPG